MFAEVIVPGKKKKRTRYCCSLQELGLVMYSRAHKQLPTRAAMFAEVMVPCKKEKRTRYCCSLQELGLVMCARTVCMLQLMCFSASVRHFCLS